MQAKSESKSTELIISNITIPNDIVAYIVAILLKSDKPSIAFPSIFSLCVTNYALQFVISNIEFIKPEKLRITEQNHRNMVIPSIMAKFKSVFSSHKDECGNDYGRAMYMLGDYCSLFSNSANYHGYANRSQSKTQVINFIKGKWQHNHIDTIVPVLLSHYNADSYCGRALLFGDYKDVQRLLNHVKTALLEEGNAFNPKGALATVINDIQILCKINCIDVVALSKEIEASKNINSFGI
jgi:hypothetical protein